MIHLAYPVLALVQQSGLSAEQPLWLTMTQSWSEVIWRGATVVAIFVGGFFTWYKFLRGRELVQRAEPKLSAGDCTRRDGVIVLRSDASAKNIGSSRIDIDHAATAIEVWLLKPGSETWEKVPGVMRVFKEQDTLEPNEQLGEPVRIELPDGDYLAAMVNLNFYATGRRDRWCAKCYMDLAKITDHPRLF